MAVYDAHTCRQISVQFSDRYIYIWHVWDVAKAQSLNKVLSCKSFVFMYFMRSEVYFYTSNCFIFLLLSTFFSATCTASIRQCSQIACTGHMHKFLLNLTIARKKLFLGLCWRGVLISVVCILRATVQW